MTHAVLQLLQLLYERRLTEWGFETEKQQRLSYKALRYQLKKACAAADVPYKGEHVLRHIFTANCYHKGIDVKILSKLSGHSDVNITNNIYIHLYGDGFDELYDALVPK